MRACLKREGRRYDGKTPSRGKGAGPEDLREASVSPAAVKAFAGGIGGGVLCRTRAGATRLARPPADRCGKPDRDARTWLCDEPQLKRAGAGRDPDRAVRDMVVKLGKRYIAVDWGDDEPRGLLDR